MAYEYIPVGLYKIVGGEVEARQEFIKMLNQTKIGEDVYKFAMVSYEHGITSAFNMVMDAIRRGEIEIIIHGDDGNIYEYFPLAMKGT